MSDNLGFFKGHPTATIESPCTIGDDTRIWHHAHIRQGAQIGKGCVIGKNVFIDHDVIIGDYCKIQNNVSVYHGVTLEAGVFVGPSVVFTNDLYPRSLTELGFASEWKVTPTLVQHNASIGAGAVIRCGLVIGAWAMVGCGAVVIKPVPDHGLVYGNPARLEGFVCYCGRRMLAFKHIVGAAQFHCSHCEKHIPIPFLTFRAFVGNDYALLKSAMPNHPYEGKDKP